jgi:serine/threonine-protein kinase
VIADRYELELVIGTGGMGEVWRATHTRLQSKVAVKIIHDRLAESAEQRERFLREARACAAIRGSHVVSVYDCGVEGDAAYIAMELLEGESLAIRLARERALAPATTARIVGQVAKAIGRAHRRGIAHRDLKPSNIHLVRDEDEPEEIVKVLDFGIAKLLDGRVEDLTRTGELLGTIHFMSPEQARGTKEIDHRADLWSLAILAYRCLTGELPIKGETASEALLALLKQPMPLPSEVARHLPPAFDGWFATGTRRAPEERFGSATEMAEALTQALAVS